MRRRDSRAAGRWQTSLISLSANVFGLIVEVTSAKAIAA
jgi:hypothetical protein